MNDTKILLIAMVVLVLGAVAVCLFTIDNPPTVCGQECQLERELEGMVNDGERMKREVERLQRELDDIDRQLAAASQPSSQPASQP